MTTTLFGYFIHRERSDLLSTVNTLRSTVSSLQQREADALAQIQQSVEVAEQAQLERIQVRNNKLMYVVLFCFSSSNFCTTRWKAKFDDCLL